MQYGEPVGPVAVAVSALPLSHGEDPAGPTSCPVQELVATSRIGYLRLEQLAHHAEGERTLQLAPATGEDAHRPFVCEPAGLGQQAGLADARGTLDEQQSMAPFRKVVQRTGERGHLTVALDQAVLLVNTRRLLSCALLRQAQRGGLSQHLRLELTQSGAGVDAELLDQRRACPTQRA